MFTFDLHPDEKLVRVYRQSEWVLAKPVILVLLAMYLPWYLLIKYELHVEYRYWLLGWTLLVLLFFANKWLLWLLNTYVLTDRRLVCLYYSGIFRKVVMEAPLLHIQNVSFGTRGLLSVLMRYGDVYVQTAGLPDALVVANVRNPSRVKDYLWRLREFAEKSRQE